MYTPLICTTNSLGTIDYGVPIVANKSTDYRTASRIGHRHLPNIPQDFNTRSKAKIKNELLQTDIAIKEEGLKSLYNATYQRKEGLCSREAVANHCQEVNFTRNVQEKIFQNPPRSMARNMSEMKASYQQKYPTDGHSLVTPPAVYSKCELKSLGRDEQPGIPPEEKGFWKWLDPYMSTARATHVPFTKGQQNGIGRKDIVTFYDASGVPKAKGFGPKNGPSVEPLQSVRKEPVYDKVTFKLPGYDRIVYTPMKRVPNSGMKSEYQGNYKHQSYSDLYPYLFENGIRFEDSLSDASPWQCLPAPGAYCTEACHIGTGWPIRAVVDPGLPKEYPIHKPCCVKVATK